MKKLAIILCLTAMCAAANAGERWSEERANQWYATQEWPVGMDYIPSTAVNALDMWQAETFDEKTIDRELGWAENLGFNCARIFLSDLVWSYDPEGFKDRLDKYLEISDKHGIKTIVTFFTNGGKNFEPKLGEQPAPKPNVHNSQWCPSPGPAVVNDPTQWPRIKRYVQDVLTRFDNDDRILLWSLYNEPENYSRGANSLPLLRTVFEWAREVDPSQPLSSPMWNMPCSEGLASHLPIVSFLCENCDVLTFHCYEGPEKMQKYVNYLKEFNRPIVCTEYMSRPRSTFQEIMPILKADKVGAINFGLVQGKMQTDVQPSKYQGKPGYDVWFHDIFYKDGKPYSQEEVDFIRTQTGK